MKNLRVYVEKENHEFYEKLVKRGTDNPDHFPFQTMKDLFLFAACLGVKYNSYLPLKSSKDIFNSDVFDEKTDVPVLAAIAFSKDDDISILGDEKRILEIVQDYANGGIHLVVEEIINNPGKPLNNLINVVLYEK